MKKVLLSPATPPTETKMEQGCNTQSASVADNVTSVLQKISAASTIQTADDVKYDDYCDKALITTGKEYPPKQLLLDVKGIKTLSLGDLHMIQAQAKQGKTTLITIMVAAILAGQWGVVEYALDRPAKVVVFDTEQFECDTFRQYQSMMAMGHMKTENLSLLTVYNLRGMSYEERNEFIRMYIRREKPTLVVIDGIRDLVPDINDPIACPQFVQDMMQLASEVECAIIGVLHNNPGEGKARGWLGTEWINKCGYSFEPVKENNVVTVKNTIYRGAPVPDWQFTFDNYGYPTCDDFYIQFATREAELQRQREAEEERDRKNKEHLDIVLQVLEDHDNEYSRSEFVTIIDSMNIDGFRRRKVYEFIKEHISISDPLFIERNGKMVLTKHGVQ